MGILDDFLNFLENSIEDFLQKNPELNLNILAQEIKQEKRDTLELISQLENQEKQVESQILATAEDIKKWAQREEKARNLQRYDLAQDAAQVKYQLLEKGSYLWQEMTKLKEKIAESKRKLASLEKKEMEVNLKLEEIRREKARETGVFYERKVEGKSYHDIEQKFRNWEIEMELEEMKKKMGG
ncbi:MAG: TIGR04376 family protein [Geminocystis sp.]|nr:TIGR04376 family protein [Geminocystis sp.]HIK37230.1 TIGR04376 family protein [Geminocystis sp. M7585_C2015_104]MCS7147442.1 TIGR04376 family protein [Geminocystis sp.]MCX8079591.1 TIGR04376 family protein [Geminocystis sp.]MDW8115135.1 TIGR04376 family protein [Geminocystis sp.]